MSADSEDPAELCVVACRAIRDFDTSFQQHAQFGHSTDNDGDEDFADDVSAIPADLGPAAKSLVAIPASNPKKKFPTVDFETVTAGPGAVWVSACTDLHLAGGRLVGRAAELSVPSQPLTETYASAQPIIKSATLLWQEHAEPPATQWVRPIGLSGTVPLHRMATNKVDFTSFYGASSGAMETLTQLPRAKKPSHLASFAP
jgi:hypothetical protein